MRIVHTADWHLGRKLHHQPLIADQEWILERLRELVLAEAPHLLVVAGDVYDRSVPPSEAVRLLDDFLTWARRDRRLRVVMIAGNHDGPERLGFLSRLLDDDGIHIRGLWDRLDQPVEVDDADGPVAVYPLPFLDPEALRVLWPDEEGVTGQQGAAVAAMARVRADRRRRGGRAVLVAHAFVTGGEGSESERELAVGGAGDIPAEVFRGFDYLALGHLHRPQEAGGNAVRGRYSGSLLKYSFSEADHDKGVTLVELGRDGRVETRHLPLRPRRDLKRLDGTLDQLLHDPAHEPWRDAYIEAGVRGVSFHLDLMGELRRRFPNVLSLRRPDLEGAATAEGPLSERVRRAAGDDRALFASFVETVRGEHPASEEETATFLGAVSGLARRAPAGESGPDGSGGDQG